MRFPCLQKLKTKKLSKKSNAPGGPAVGLFLFFSFLSRSSRVYELDQLMAILLGYNF